MKTNEELKELREEIETLGKKLSELTEEELEQVTGGKNGWLGTLKVTGSNPYSDYFKTDETKKKYEYSLYKDTLIDFLSKADN